MLTFAEFTGINNLLPEHRMGGADLVQATDVDIGLTGEITPIRHPAKRRRLKTVLQEIMYRAAKFSAHARRLVLDFGRGVAAHAKVFIALQERLLRAASP